MATSLLGAFLAIYFSMQFFLLHNFKLEEAQQVEQDIKRAAFSISNRATEISRNCSDWARWDDTYAFIQNKSPQFIATNLVDDTFNNLGLNIILFIDTSGHLVFGKAFDLEEQKQVALPESLLRQVTPDDLLLQHADTASLKKGLLVLPEGALAVASLPILTSELQGPIRGTLIMGRFFDRGLYKTLQEQTQLNFDVAPLKPAGADSGNALSKLKKGASFVSLPQGRDLVNGYALIKDVYGNDALLLKVVIPRTIYKNGLLMLHYLQIMLFFIALSVIALLLFITEKLVLAPLSGLSANVESISRSGDISARVSVQGNDELARLGKETNKMLQSLQKSEERFRVAAESASDIIYEWDINSGELKWFGAIDRLLGYGPNEFPRTLEAWEQAIHPEDQDRVKKALALATGAGDKFLEEYRIKRQDGQYIYWKDTGIKVSIPGSKESKMIGAISDISEHKIIEARLRAEVENRTAELQEEKSGLEEKVKQRTKDLEERMIELEKFHSTVVNRELRLIELEKEVNGLLEELGRAQKYKTQG
ncbi:MAG: CHASE4 domain-containing protein [Candidatus Margulisiibacteriota bacterium]